MWWKILKTTRSVWVLLPQAQNRHESEQNMIGTMLCRTNRTMAYRYHQPSRMTPHTRLQTTRGLDRRWRLPTVKRRKQSLRIVHEHRRHPHGASMPVLVS